MSTFDPMAAAVDWLDAYRAASLTIVSMYLEMLYWNAGATVSRC